jgi:hypothetical protein
MRSGGRVGHEWNFTMGAHRANWNGCAPQKIDESCRQHTYLAE